MSLRYPALLPLLFVAAHGACVAGGGGVPQVACVDPLVAASESDAGPDATEAEGGAASTGGSDGDGGAGPARVCTANQRVFVCDLVNARDLTGTPLTSGQTVGCGRIYRGPPLAGLSAQGCRLFAQLGVRTVVDLRTDDERSALPESPCVRTQAALVAAPMPIPYNVSAQDYVTDLNATTSVAAAFRVLGDPAAYPVYVHCTWGRDRTGVLTAVILSALGASRDTILREYALSQATVGAFPTSLMAVLDELARRGGVEAYLAAAGVSAEQLATLRAQAVAQP